MRKVQIHDSLHHNWDITTNLRPTCVIRCLTIGWTNFLIEKQLRMSDMCMFELLNNEPPKFIVYKKRPHQWKFDTSMTILTFSFIPMY